MTSRALKLFLAFALTWPITVGDKIAQLPNPDAKIQGCSSPWQMYRGLASALFGTASHDRAEGSSFSGRLVQDSPAAFFPVHPSPSPALGAPRRVRSSTPPDHDPPGWNVTRAVPPPVPVLPPHLKSKK